MKQGLLWFDNDLRRTLEDKVAQAAERHLQKFGYQPDTCYVNPGMLAGLSTPSVAGVRIVAAKNVLLHHLWVGVEPAERELGKAS